MTDRARAPRSGTQLSIAAAGYTAAIATVGATLRALEHDGRALITTFDADEVRPVFRGAVLAPWPNRVVDGRYRFDGAEYELALTEPTRGHALHGLVAWQDFDVDVADPDHVRLSTTIAARDSYPFQVLVTVDYRVDADGFHTTITGTNLGSDAAPWGTGPHPYVVAGEGSVDDWTVHIPADLVLDVTPDRLIPIDLVDPSVVAHGELDLREPARIGPRFIDHAYSGLRRDDEGDATITVRADDGHGVAVRFGPTCEWVQVHTADHVNPDYHRRGLAVEPMTCAPDAFNTGSDRGLVVLQPGDAHDASWTIAAI
ncbi:aldose 1-epimerase family protein [Curtobacterium ammoniigenes]|uniref:aldose 1-epimerase family protein n=1 Tax=Curtobacterium ammoniigenes TaxID=395387 RepID=UPI00082FA96E|nr:aldose 1-epimerase family protein [Curtobacterium ammoniigenes]